MPDATGTPSTNFQLPKYDPDNDAPSGLGFNTFVDDLDSKLKTKVPNHLITSLGANDVPIWNGTTWVRASGTPDSSKFLRGDGQWAVPAEPSYTWTSYTPSWTNTGTANTLGNGTISGSYLQVGKIAFVKGTLTFGSTTVPGSGIWVFSLPLSGTGTGVVGGSAVSADSGVANYLGHPIYNTATTFTVVYPTPSGGGTLAWYSGTGGAFTFATGDYLLWFLMYEVA